MNYKVGDFVKFITDRNHEYDWNAIILSIDIHKGYGVPLHKLELIDCVAGGSPGNGHICYAPIDGLELIIDEQEINRLSKLIVFS